MACEGRPPYYVPRRRLPLVGLFMVEVFRDLRRVLDLPENDDRTFLALADVSVQFVSLAEREPKW